MPQPFTRRHFLNMVGAAGGSAAVLQAAVALGLMPSGAEAHTPRAELMPLGRNGRSVVVLGAGLSGLVCAYELERAGYDVTVIEASKRIGGRNMTVRSGDLIDEMGNPQICQFDDHPNLYMNCGPARIPAHHSNVLHYCKTLNVPLEVFVNVNYHAYVQDPDAFGGRPIRMREYMADARGFMTELAAKAISQPDFDAPFSAEDMERFLAFLRAYGDLDPNLLYKGSARAGYASGGMTEPPTLKPPLDFSEILKSSFWRFRMHWGEGEDQAAPLMQAVGGNDNIVKGFVRNIRSRIVTGAPVQSITLREDGVDVVYDDRGRPRQVSADYCFNCIPKHLLHGIPNNFPVEYSTAMANVGRGKLFKIGLQMRERFWERENIYGGISWTNQDVEQIWYPSHGIHGDKGVMLGAYVFNDETNDRLARLSQAERIEVAVRAGEQIHPDYRKYVETGVTIAWHRMNYLMGCTAKWTEEARERYFKTLQDPVGRHYLIGDQVSYHPGWQEGAISSAHHALADLDQRVRAEMGHSATGAA
ncbi:MAG: flavin monoamine oxidase family protein [Pseudomonadales bacterium]